MNGKDGVGAVFKKASAYCCALQLQNTAYLNFLKIICIHLTRSLREPGGPCTKSMVVSESRMERVKYILTFVLTLDGSWPRS